MIKTIKYTLLAEGIVENTFIPLLLDKIHSGKIKFSKSNLNIKQSSSPSKSKVLKNISSFVKESLVNNEEDYFIVGVDLDLPDHDLVNFKNQSNSIKSLIPQSIDNSKVIIFIPVQAFDHWLLYQSYKIKNSKRIVNNSLESKSSQIVKKDLYGKANPDSYLINIKAKEILKVIDIADLAKQSKSFNHFYEQIRTIA